MRYKREQKREKRRKNKTEKKNRKKRYLVDRRFVTETNIRRLDAYGAILMSEINDQRSKIIQNKHHIRHCCYEGRNIK